MSSNPAQEMAECLLEEMKGALVEAINGSRKLTENELHALVRCYIKAKPHLSQEFEVEWCTDLLTMINFEEVLGDSGNAAETFKWLVENMMKNK